MGRNIPSCGWAGTAVKPLELSQAASRFKGRYKQKYYKAFLPIVMYQSGKVIHDMELCFCTVLCNYHGHMVTMRNKLTIKYHKLQSFLSLA